MIDGPSLINSFPLVERAFEISSKMRIGIYDCIYAALAEQEGCELVTADETLCRVLQPHFTFIKSLSSM